MLATQNVSLKRLKRSACPQLYLRIGLQSSSPIGTGTLKVQQFSEDGKDLLCLYGPACCMISRMQSSLLCGSEWVCDCTLERRVLLPSVAQYWKLYPAVLVTLVMSGGTAAWKP